MGQIHWGDFPTWIAVFFAAVGGTVALIQLRQQGNVLKGEVERNKRRDELLDGQLSDLKEREQDRVREQAELIDVEWTPDSNRNPFGSVANNSRRPITSVVGGVVAPQPDGGLSIQLSREWQMRERKPVIVVVGAK